MPLAPPGAKNYGTMKGLNKVVFPPLQGGGSQASEEAWLIAAI